jgi:lactoylglutathione lyase
MGTALNVADLERSVRFYTEGLGLKIATRMALRGTRTETILAFPGPPMLLLMHDTAPDWPRQIEPGNGFSRLVIRTNDLDALSARLTALGYTPGQIRSAAQGYRIIMLRDPDGYGLEIVQPGPSGGGATP